MVNKKKYFRKKLDGVESMIFDLEFKRFKTKEIREEVRVEYDNQKSKRAVIETQIRSQKKDPDKVCPVHNPATGEEKKHKDHATCVCEFIDNRTIEVGEYERLYDKRDIIDRDVARFLEQIKQLDLEVNGSRPTAEYQDGVQGITQQLDALHELKGMIKSYVKQL